MAYIGNIPAESYSAFQKQDFSTSATTSYTLDHPVSNQNEIALFINFVRQEPTAAYTASGTTLTLTSATSSSDDMYCVYLGKAVQTVNPPSGSVGLSQLSATGTKDSTTFLRGDNTFAVAGGTNTPSFMAVQTSATSLSAGAFTKVQFNSEIFDTDNTYDNSTNYRFTPATAGKYMIGASASCIDLDPDEFFKISIYKNGSETITSNSINYKVTQQTRIGNSLNPSLVVSVVDLADSDDYYEVFAFNGDGGANNTDLNLGNFFYAYKIIE